MLIFLLRLTRKSTRTRPAIPSKSRKAHRRSTPIFDGGSPMIVYSSTKAEFIRDVRVQRIEETIRDVLSRKLHRRVPESEFRAWKNPLNEMFKVLLDDGIPGEAGVAIEYNLPLTSKRVDFILSGQTADS